MRPRRTSQLGNGISNTLLYAHHGWGKTWQCSRYAEAFGPGLILSGESGLSTLRASEIDFLPFNRWDGPPVPDPQNPDEEVYSFRHIVSYMQTEEFRELGYKWVALDSITELGQQLEHHMDTDPEFSGLQGWHRWANLGAKLTGAARWFRNLPCHVLITAIARETEGKEDGEREFWPSVPGRTTMRALPAMFDNVLCGFRRQVGSTDEDVGVTRLLLTDEVYGWQGKIRDPHQRTPPLIRCGNIVDVIRSLDMTPEEHAAWVESVRPTTDEERDVATP